MLTGSPVTLSLPGKYIVKRDYFFHTEEIGTIILDFEAPTFSMDVIEYDERVSVTLEGIKDNYTGVVDVECRYKDSNNLIKNMSINSIRREKVFNLPIRKKNI